MFEVGFSELVMICLVGLMVVGPQRLPRLAREAACWLRKARSLIANAQADIQRELALDDLKLPDNVREISRTRFDPMAPIHTMNEPSSAPSSSGLDHDSSNRQG